MNYVVSAVAVVVIVAVVIVAVAAAVGAPVVAVFLAMLRNIAVDIVDVIAAAVAAISDYAPPLLLPQPWVRYQVAECRMDTIVLLFIIIVEYQTDEVVKSTGQSIR